MKTLILIAGWLSVLHVCLAAPISAGTENLVVGTTVIGTVQFTATDTQVCANFAITNTNYKILETHFHEAALAADFPQDNNGVLLPNWFSQENRLCCAPATTDRLCVSKACPYTTLIAAHAFVQQYDSLGNAVGGYQSAQVHGGVAFQAVVDCTPIVVTTTAAPEIPCNGGTGSDCDTTWPRSRLADANIVSYTFSDYLKISSAWGWAVCISKPGVYTADIWAGAGLNDVTKATDVGDLIINLTCSSATSCQITVEYRMATKCSSKNNRILEQAHLSIAKGTTSVYTKAPGQLYYVNEFATRQSSYLKTTTQYCNGNKGCSLLPILDPSVGSNPPVCVVAHGVACGFCRAV